MWVARDENDRLYLYIGSKPERTEHYWGCRESEDRYLELPYNMFPKLRWEDEPLEVELVEVKR
jgi:hypothetical protein